MTNDLDIIILAAGMGTRMKSDTVKILHRAAGRPIIEYVLDTAAELSSRPPIMVVGHQRDAVQQAVGERARYAVQEPQLGTGHAVLQAIPHCSQRRVLILSGDVPLTRPATLRRLLDEHARAQNALTVLTMRVRDRKNRYGRIVRDGDDSVARIVEVRDASDDEKKIDEVNAGVYVFECRPLAENLQKLSTNNSQGEYYLTDLVGMLRGGVHRVGAAMTDQWVEAIGVNSRAEVAIVE